MSQLSDKNQKPVEQEKIIPRSTGKPSRSMKRRIMQRVIFALLFSAAVIGAQEMGWLNNISRQWTKQKVNWMDNKQVTQYLRTVITDNQLTQTPTNCLVFVINNDNGGEIVNMQVREQHNSSCSNTRTDFPILFTFRVNRTDGNIQVDKGSPNHFYPIH
ncbi:unnamed protein product [Commensalibacter communis]|uniref:hypothetical protein n=1 Tax=Commensalibacter communis TaxID=2972786 RepID=UPI0022FF74A7|nr:hypothetical protein [Commensalibacter communis]CAI3924481.1 unnamed protein product [Commensalibacter communis]CAI3934915.1 unnamed protein product [Commensalibacter communis]